MSPSEKLEFYRAFAGRLRAARLALGLDERQAAQTCKVSVRRYRQFESGNPIRGAHRAIFLFARGYSVKLDWLFGRVSGFSIATATVH